MLNRATVEAIAGQVEALDPDEALSVELSAAERAEMLHEVQQVVDVLRARGHRPSVTVRRSANGEVHAVALE